MANEVFNLYNVKNHKLNAKQLEQLFTFATGNYCGVLSDSGDNPLTLILHDGTQDGYFGWQWSYNPVQFIGGGVSIDLQSADITPEKFITTYNSDNVIKPLNTMWYIECSLTDDEEVSSIKTDRSISVKLKSINNEEFDRFSIIKTTKEISISQVIEGVTDVTETFESFIINFPYDVDENNNVLYKEFEYISNTIWLKDSEKFIIPLVVCLGSSNIDEVQLIQLLKYIDKTSFDRFLSADLYFKLKQWASDTFTFRVGGAPDEYKPENALGAGKGTVGTLNITGHWLRNIRTNPSLRRTKYSNSNPNRQNRLNKLTIDIRHIYFTDLDNFNDVSDSDLDTSGRILPSKVDTYRPFNTTYALYTKNYPDTMEGLDDDSSTNLTSDRYARKLVQGTLPIAAGGTGAKDKDGIKRNIGIKYGTSEPTGTADKGDIYFRYI